MNAPVPVATTVAGVGRIDPPAVFAALTRRFGDKGVFLLESTSGPARDVRKEFIGFGELVSLSVVRGRIDIAGVPAVVDIVTARVLPLVDRIDGELRLRSPRDLWEVLRAAGSAFAAEGSDTSFRFGFLAHFGYDAARYIEDLPYLIDSDSDLPDVHLALHQCCLVTDLLVPRTDLLVHSSPAWPDLDPLELRVLVQAASREAAAGGAVRETVVAVEAHDDTQRAEYVEGVGRSHEYIAAGDIYQVQIGHEISMASDLEPLEVYRRLRRRNPSPYMYLTTVGEHTVVGASPELFVRVERGLVTMRPIAGTVPRGVDGDDIAALRLVSDPKELAEHTMLVDLCRNDIGRICEPGSLDVPDELVVERFSHVQHMVSTVVGRAEQDVDAYDVIAATFPAGTVTGTPKIRAMEIIEELERSRRGLYAGALGLIDLGGYVNLALCIRTLVHHDGVYRTRASAGVVVDSDAEREWVETLAKSGAACWAVTGRELL